MVKFFFYIAQFLICFVRKAFSKVLPNYLMAVFHHLCNNKIQTVGQYKKNTKWQQRQDEPEAVCNSVEYFIFNLHSVFCLFIRNIKAAPAIYVIKQNYTSANVVNWFDITIYYFNKFYYLLLYLLFLLTFFAIKVKYALYNKVIVE